jgi:hypothetical protein
MMDIRPPGMEIGILALGPIVLLAFLVILVVTAVWVYRDATTKGNKDAAIWTVGSLLVWPVVLIVYLIVRPKPVGSSLQ